jgi:putative ABC transport system permease protein
VTISVKAKEGQLRQAEDQARMITRSLHRLTYHEKDDFGLITSEGVNELFDNLTRIIFSVSLFVVGISLVVGGIVIMNIMLATVTERTREIGIRKSLGATRKDILIQFLVESVMLSALGGVIGLLLAITVMSIVGRFAPVPVAVPFWAPAIAISVSTLVGLFFGVYPARKAARLDPIVALRAD